MRPPSTTQESAQWDGSTESIEERSPTVRLQRTLGNQAIQRFANRKSVSGSKSPPVTRSGVPPGLERGGRPLRRGLLEPMERSFGEDFGDVRVHDGAEARAATRSLASRAFTAGNHIWMGGGATADDRSLLAHELTHVVQQRDGFRATVAKGINENGALEWEAERASRRTLVPTAPVEVSLSTPRSIQRQGLTVEEIRAELRRIDEHLAGTSPSPGELEQLQAQRDLLLRELERLTGSAARRLPEDARTRTDPGDLTGDELRARIERLREWRYSQPAESSIEIETVDEEIRSLEAELIRKQGLAVETEQSVVELARLQREGTLPGHETNIAGGVFVGSFLSAAVEQIPSNDYERLGLELLADPVSFVNGVKFGVAVGAGEQLWDNVLGLVDLAELSLYFNPVTGPMLAAEEGIRYALDPEHAAKRRRQVEQAREIVAGLQELVVAIANDPAFFTTHGAELGRITGHQAGSWFHEDFMLQSTFLKGQTVGEIAGRVILEIAMLFLGPEEWIVRGVVGVGQAARYSGKLVRAVREFLERIPGLSRILRRGAGAAEEVGGGARAIGELADTAGDAGRAADEAMEVVTPQTRHVNVSRPDLLARYEQLATEKMPSVVADVLRRQRSTPTRRRLQNLKNQFDSLRTRVGDRALTETERAQAVEILSEARILARRDFNNLTSSIWRRLRSDPDLEHIANKMVRVGDAQVGGRTGSVRINTAWDDGRHGFEALNIEHRTRLSDNPWRYNDPENLILTDASQNQQYLEAIRREGGIWATDDIERFVVSHGLSNVSSPGTQ